MSKPSMSIIGISEAHEKQLIRLCAIGLGDMEISRTFYDWGVEGITQHDVRTFRRVNADRIAEAVEKYKKDAIFMASRSHHEFRVAEMNYIADGLKSSIEEYLVSGDGKNAAKVTDTYLRLLRLMAEETGRIPQVRQQNTYIAIMQDASPEERKRIAEQLKAIEKMQKDLLGSGSSDEIIDADFVVDASDE